jgi:hypothetical protein
MTAKKQPAKRPVRKRAAKPPAPKGPQPIRPLGSVGQSTWDRIVASKAGWIQQEIDVELLQIVCEQIDERASLRFKVLRENDWRDRNALRALDQQILNALSLLGLTPTDRSRTGLTTKGTDDDLASFLTRLSTPVRNTED